MQIFNLPRIMTKEACIMLIIMFFGVVYNAYSNYKYKNCDINRFEFIDISDKGEIIVSAKLPKILEMQKIYVKVNGFALPNKNSDNACEKEVYRKVKSRLSKANSSSEYILFLSKCIKGKDKIIGTIKDSDGNDIIILLNKSNILPDIQKQSLWKRFLNKKPEINWCKYVN